jgi:hypothetical protein
MGQMQNTWTPDRLVGDKFRVMGDKFGVMGDKFGVGGDRVKHMDPRSGRG